jgi:hypothetical protein
MFPIHFNPCYSIKLQIFLLLPPINISKKRLGCSERIKKTTEHLRFSSKSSSLKERYVFLQGAKVELGFHHCHHISPFVTTSTYLYIHHIHTPTIFHHTSTTYIGPHTCTSWFDCMTRFSGSVVWLYNICLQVCMSCLPIYELHISLLVIGWEREGTMLLCLMPKIPHILSEEKRHTS